MPQNSTSDSIHKAASILASGGVIAYPTEAVFGLGCMPDNQQALKRLLEIKQRPIDKGLILIASEIQQLESFVDFKQLDNIEEISATWPGPVTWLVPCSESTSPLLRGKFDTLAVRVSDHPMVRALCAITGPITSTSANLTGEEPARSTAELSQDLTKLLDFILPGEVGDLSSPTEIRHAKTGEIVRPSVA